MTRPPALANPALADACPPDDRFVPVDPHDLIDHIALDTDVVSDADQFRRLADALEMVIHQERTHFERRLTRAYAPLDPDNECVRPRAAQAPPTDQDRNQFLARFTHLLDKTNFERLEPAQIDLAVKAANSHRLRVVLNPDLIDHLDIWVRGRTTLLATRRTPRHPIKGVRRTLDAFSRLVVVTQLNGDPHVSIKLFRQIPIADLEALLPHAQITMSWFDRAKVFGGSVGTAGATAVKVFKIGLTVVAVSKLVWIIAFGCVVLTARGILGYRTTRLRRDSQRTQHLYYQNLANNASVLHRLVAALESEELKEALLAYAFCRASPRGVIDGPRSLADAVENYLDAHFSCRVDFDAEDALETLTRLKLWQDQAAFRVLPPDEAIALLDDHWRGGRSREYHETQLAK